MDEWQPIETAPKKGEVELRSADGRTMKAIWYFGDWGTTEPILGDRLDNDFKPTHWR